MKHTHDKLDIKYLTDISFKTFEAVGLYKKWLDKGDKRAAMEIIQNLEYFPDYINRLIFEMHMKLGAVTYDTLNFTCRKIKVNTVELDVQGEEEVLPGIKWKDFAARDTNLGYIHADFQEQLAKWLRKINKSKLIDLKFELGCDYVPYAKYTHQDLYKHHLGLAVDFTHDFTGGPTKLRSLLKSNLLRGSKRLLVKVYRGHLHVEYRPKGVSVTGKVLHKKGVANCALAYANDLDKYQPASRLFHNQQQIEQDNPFGSNESTYLLGSQGESSHIEWDL